MADNVFPSEIVKPISIFMIKSIKIMVYAFLKVWVNWTIRIFFRKINTSGIENVPEGKALLLASNHPNGFVEPITMACLFPRALHFLVRGDVFEKPGARGIMERTNQIPIFRFKDGFENLRKNNKSIEISLKKLQEGEAILIFVEGGTKAQKRLRPLQKGLSRIAFQVLEKDSDLQLDILPVGLNYFDNTKFRSESILSVGEPMSANEYYEKYKDDVNNGIRTLTKDISGQIKKNVIHLDDLNDTGLLNNLLLLRKAVQNHSILPIVSNDNHSIKADKNIANELNVREENEKKTWLDKSKAIIEKYGHKSLLNRYHSRNSLFVNTLLILLLAVPAFVGLLINAIPFFGGYFIANATAKKSIFYMSIWLSAFSLLSISFYLVATIVSCLIVGWIGLLILLGIPFFTITMIWLDRWNEMQSQISLGSKRPKAITEIKELFKELNLGL